VGGCRNRTLLISLLLWFTSVEPREIMYVLTTVAPGHFSGVDFTDTCTRVSVKKQHSIVVSKTEKRETGIRPHVYCATTSPDVVAQHRVYVV
jgi:hypothetical protein